MTQAFVPRAQWWTENGPCRTKRFCGAAPSRGQRQGGNTPRERDPALRGPARPEVQRHPEGGGRPAGGAPRGGQDPREAAASASFPRSQLPSFSPRAAGISPGRCPPSPRGPGVSVGLSPSQAVVLLPGPLRRPFRRSRLSAQRPPPPPRGRRHHREVWLPPRECGSLSGHSPL